MYPLTDSLLAKFNNTVNEEVEKISNNYLFFAGLFEVIRLNLYLSVPNWFLIFSMRGEAISYMRDDDANRDNIDGRVQLYDDKNKRGIASYYPKTIDNKHYSSKDVAYLILKGNLILNWKALDYKRSKICPLIYSASDDTIRLASDIDKSEANYLLCKALCDKYLFQTKSEDDVLSFMMAWVVATALPASPLLPKGEEYSLKAFWDKHISDKTVLDILSILEKLRVGAGQIVYKLNDIARIGGIDEQTQ